MSKLLIFLLLSISLVQGSRICYKCQGIQCSRTSHNETKICEDSLDICVTIFEDFNVVESGCSEEISSNLMKKCSVTNNDEDEENDEINENIENFDCHKCNEDFCNNEGRQEFQCIQCDSNLNPDCKNNPNNIVAKSCPKPTSTNSYCFTKYNDDESIVRGCSVNLKDQRDCLRNNNCMLCLAGDIDNCNVGQFRDNGGNSGGSNNTTPTPPHTNNTTSNVTGGSNNTTPTPPYTNNTTSNVTGGSNNTTPTPPYTNNTTSNVTGGSNNTTPTPPHTNNTTVLPNNNTTQTIITTTPKPTLKPNSANAINLTLSILIVSVILHLFD